MTFRLATEAELPLLFDLINESYLPDDAFFLEGPRLGKLQDLLDMQAKGPFHVLLGELDPGSGKHDDIIGCVQLTPGRFEQPRKMAMSLLAVRQSCKKRGLAAKIADLSHQYAKDTGHVTVKIYVVSVKPWLVGLYGKLGYVATGEAPWVGEHVELTKPCHFITMEKPL